MDKIIVAIEKLFNVNVLTDWWIFGATIGAGILSALATMIAVIYTNKTTADRYEQDKKRQDKDNAMVILKPTIKSGSFGGIVEELILYNIRDRVLLLSSEKDGFDFCDDDDRLYQENHRIFSIKNESKNSIRLIKIDTYSKITTETDAKIEDKTSNFVKLLRDNEEIIFRMYSTEQRTKLWEQIEKDKQVILTFICEINYMTFAGEQICYKYEVEVTNIPVKRTYNGKDVMTNNAKTSIIKDEYCVLNEVTLNEESKASVFRNLQDFIQINRVKYVHKIVGEAQAKGFMNEFGQIFNNPFDLKNIPTLPKTEEEISDKTNV